MLLQTVYMPSITQNRQFFPRAELQQGLTSYVTFTILFHLLYLRHKNI